MTGFRSGVPWAPRWSTLQRLTVLLVVAGLGCRAADYRRSVDQVTYGIITEKQQAAFGKAEPFTIETPADTLRRRLLLDQNLPHATAASVSSKDVEPIDEWPDNDYLEKSDPNETELLSPPEKGPLVLTLVDALQVAAFESRDYRTQKERVFRTALNLDLEANEFRQTWAGIVDSEYFELYQQTVVVAADGRTDQATVRGSETSGLLALDKQFRNGLTFSGQIGLDLVSLLTQEKVFSRGLFADITMTLPLMRGSGEFVVTEPLKQAERDVVYALYEFERFKREFAVDIASDYLNVLRQLDSVDNAADNYERLIALTRRARALADAGRLSEIQIDQSRQDELRARNQWVSALERYSRTLDGFKLQLGLPPDADVVLDRGELEGLVEVMGAVIAEVEATEEEAEMPAADAPITLPPPGQGVPGRYELDLWDAVVTGLSERLDLRVAIGQVYDSQRDVAVAADLLRADLTLLGSGAAGARRALASVRQEDASLIPDEGVYSALITIDLPFERTAERTIYRESLINFEVAVRAVQALEDQIKLDISNGLSELLEARETILVQAESVRVAERRVESTNLFLEAERAEIRDVLEAQDALINAQNALTAALVSYRIGELSLQRDLGVLSVDSRGLWTEFEPQQLQLE